MGLWNKLFGGRRREELAPQRLDYLNEALALERQGDYEAALTSYRLALRDNPADLRVLQNIAIAFTKTNRPDEAIRYYRRALEIEQNLPGAHYGIAFLLDRRGDTEGTRRHLEAFLESAPSGPEAEKWVSRAREKLQEVCEQPES